MRSSLRTIQGYFSDAQRRVARAVDAIDDLDLPDVDPDAAADTFAVELGLPELRVQSWTGRPQRASGALGLVLQAELEKSSKLADALSTRPTSAALSPDPPWRLELNVLFIDSGSDTASIEATKRHVEEAFAARNEEIVPKQAELRSWAKHLIVVRQESVAKEYASLHESARAAGVLLTRRSDPRAAPIDFEKKRSIVLARKTPRGETSPERALTPAQLQMILTEIWRVGRQFEVAPATYNKLEEEDLRNIIVGLLNAVFDVGATVVGEAFSHAGKTDIWLKVITGAVFVAECKWWGGSSKYLGGLDQLLGYLTHRETDAALLAFCRARDYSAVVGSARDAIASHPTTMGPLTDAGRGRFISRHRHPDDHSREATVHHMFFEVPAPAASSGQSRFRA